MIEDAINWISRQPSEVLLFAGAVAVLLIFAWVSMRPS
jgi:hypothetical protein